MLGKKAEAPTEQEEFGEHPHLTLNLFLASPNEKFLASFQHPGLTFTDSNSHGHLPLRVYKSHFLLKKKTTPQAPVKKKNNKAKHCNLCSWICIFY